jgi:hypothetical protein
LRRLFVLIFWNSACAQPSWKIMLWPDMPPTSNTGRISATRLNFWIKKIAAFLIVSALVILFYGWVSPRAFPKNKNFGFGYGILHGALMPLALPSLILGQNVEIFATDNSGRTYKIGYICGINVCGIIFFGPLFWRPKRGDGQKNREREM